MKKNRKIGAIMNRVYRESNKKTIQGIIEQAYSFGYDVAVFSTEEQYYNDKSITGENSIFSLINFDLFDGFIFSPYTFIMTDTVDLIADMLANKCHKPVVCLAKNFENFECVWQDECAEIFDIVQHLIQDHNCRDILCLTGPQDSSVAIEREQGYRNAMAHYGLTVDENSVIYGDFWKAASQKLADEIGQGKRKLPDAIVCTNDSMAISLCDALEKHNINTPNDIIITGYDGAPEALFHSPGICTYKTSYTSLGRSSMLKLYNLINNSDTADADIQEKGTLLTNTSCGCNTRIPSISSDIITNDELIEQRFLDNNMSNILLNTDTLNDFAITASNWIFLCLNEKYYEKEAFNVCLYNNWDIVNSDGLSNREENTALPESAFSLFGEQAFENFSSKQMFPNNQLRDDELSVSFFSPIHYEEHCFGYAILTLFGIADSFSMTFPRFCKDLGNSLECLCIRNRLKSMTYRAFLSDARDALTGAYRSSTLGRFWNEVTDRVKLYDENLNLCLCSVSGLQQINESYGQVEGDNILMQVASVLMGSCHNGELCIRTEGNKFLLLGSLNNGADENQSLEKEIYSKIERYNQTSGKPYRVKVCIAAKLIQAQLISDYETIYAELHKIIDSKKNSEHIRTEKIYYADFTKLRHDIYSNPEETWSVNICCEKLGMSMSHFQRLYKSIFNTSCMRDIQNSKLRHAKALLLHTSETLQCIAEKCGYDYSHFMRLFKKEVGMTPTEYRNGFQPVQNENK